MGCEVPYTSNLSADIRTASEWAADVLWMDVNPVRCLAALGRDVVVFGSPAVSSAPMFCQRATGLEPFHTINTGGHFGAHTGEEMDDTTQKFLLLPLKVRVCDRKVNSGKVLAKYEITRVEVADKIVRSARRISVARRMIVLLFLN